MNAVFTFKLSDLIAGLTRSNQWEWHGPCKAEIPTDDDKHRKADLFVGPISELVLRYVLERGLDEGHKELSAAEADGTTDGTLVRFYGKEILGKETLGVSIGLRPQKYELFRTFVTLHFGRPDLIGRIITRFVGFAASSEGGQIIPNYNEFLEGRPYLILDDSSVVFSAKPLP
jgi:hypothetical protein